MAMRFFFPTEDLQKIVSEVGKILGSRTLGDIVSLNVHGKDLELVFSKLGKSTIFLKHKVRDGGLEYSMASEKIALTHRAFKDDITRKFMDVVKQAGGQILS